MNASYTKLRDGTWGVRIAGSATVGQSITVTTKAGAAKQETIAKVLWSGNGVSICAVAQRARPVASSYSGEQRAPGGRSCAYCGSRSCSGAWGDLCDED